MMSLRSDVLIKTMRENKGWTQDELARATELTSTTISRIERGVSKPDWHSFEKILLALDGNPYDYDHIYHRGITTKEDERIADLRSKLRGLLRNNDPNNYDEAKDMFCKLESDNSFMQKGYNRSFLWRQKTTLAIYQGDYDDAYQYAFEALKVTKPNFCEDSINSLDKHIVGIDEAWSLNHIALVYFQRKKIEESTDILFYLKDAVNNSWLGGDEKIRLYIAVIYNLTTNLGILKKHKDCLPICDIGVKLCLKYQHSHHHPMLVFNKAYNLLHLKKEQEAMSLLEKCINLFSGFERHNELSQIEEFLKNEFQIEISPLKLQKQASVQ